MVTLSFLRLEHESLLDENIIKYITFAAYRKNGNICERTCGGSCFICWKKVLQGTKHQAHGNGRLIFDFVVVVEIASIIFWYF